MKKIVPLILAVTLVPALCTIFIKGRLRRESESWIVRSVLDVYRPVLNYLFDGRSIRAAANSNHSYFDDPVYNRKLAAAARLTGPGRYTAYQALETDLLRNAAPSAPLLNWQESEFFSARIGCKVYQPIYWTDLAALCLRR